MLYLYTALLIFVYMNLWFVLAISRRNNSIVDIGWGLGFIVVTIFNLFYMGFPDARQILTGILIILWGLRLSIYIFLRNKGKAEDFRYAKWRQDWGRHWLIRSYLQVFILQGFFMFTIVYPVVMLSRQSNGQLNALDLLGIIVWLAGFLIESIADYQKSKFKQNPENKRKVMNTGLWKYSRHPNYFGETLIWWGVFLIVLNVPNGIFAIFSPVIITILLTKVSGIPLIEKHHAHDPEYQEYKRHTSAFIPWKPKTTAAK
jgi:steroid 5-alpha reductase family enzyme